MDADGGGRRRVAGRVPAEPVGLKQGGYGRAQLQQQHVHVRVEEAQLHALRAGRPRGVCIG